MKNIRINYSLQIPEERFDKVRNKGKISKRVLIDDLKQRAEINGRVSVHKFIDKIIGDKNE